MSDIRFINKKYVTYNYIVKNRKLQTLSAEVYSFPYDKKGSLLRQLSERTVCPNMQCVLHRE